MVADNVAEDLDTYAEKDGTCAFCLRSGAGQATADALNHDYFTDYGCMEQDTGHVCTQCVFCIANKNVSGTNIKNGHWFVNENRFISVSSGDLLEFMQDIVAGSYETPFAFHVSDNPIRSEHAYLWTPVAFDTTVFPASFGKQTVLIDWDRFVKMVDAVEELRYYGFRLDDIRADEPTVKALQKVGRDRYRELAGNLERYRGSTLFELAITVSRGKTDQTDKEYVNCPRS